MPTQATGHSIRSVPAAIGRLDHGPRDLRDKQEHKCPKAGAVNGYRRSSRHNRVVGRQVAAPWVTPMTELLRLESGDDDERHSPLLRRIASLEAEHEADRRLLTELRDQAVERDMAYQHLDAAVASSRRIGAAIGIMMTTWQFSEDEASTALCRISQQQNRTLRSVADTVVLTGAFYLARIHQLQAL
jgi:hypothetical protein